MKDFGRMFENQKPAASVEVKKPMAPVFKDEKPKQTAFMNSTMILEWRKDLSEKVLEHVDTVGKLVIEDQGGVEAFEKQLHDLAGEVMDFVEKKDSKKLFNFFAEEKPVDMTALVNTKLNQIEAALKLIPKPDPFKMQAARRIVDQAAYLVEQLAKAGEELEEMKPNCADDIEIDCINRRCATLYKQQQLVALGSQEVSRIAADIQTHGQQVFDMLSTTIPTYRLLFRDVLSGKKQSQELRKFL